MQLNSDQVAQLLELYVKEQVIPGTPNILPAFKSGKGGHILRRRLWLVLRNPSVEHLIKGDSVEVLELFRIAREFLNKHKEIFIVGLNHWFRMKDLEVIEELYRKNFT